MGKIDFPLLTVAKIRILFNNGKKKEFFLVYCLPFLLKCQESRVEGQESGGESLESRG
jgi:hypothetical protein